MERQNSISAGQFSVMVFVSAFSPMIRILPSLAVKLGGKAVWLSPVIAAVPALLFALVVREVLKNRGEGEGLAQVICRIVGEKAGKVILTVYLLWLLFYGGFLIRTAAERLLSSVYEYGGTGVFIVVTAVVAGIMASGGVRSVARTAEASTPLIIGVLVLTAIFAAPDISAENLFPVTYRDAGGILKGAFPVADVMSITAYFGFLAGNVKKGSRKGGHLKWTAFMVVSAFFLILTTVGTLSSELVAKMQHPYFIMIRNISIFGVIERIEAVVVTLWIITDLIFLSSIFAVDRELIRSITSRRCGKWLIPAFCAVTALIAVLIAGNAFELRVFSELVVPCLNIFLTYFLITALLFAGKIKKRI